MNLSLKEQLEKIYGKPRHRKPQKRSEESLSKREIESLMDINKPTYRRYRGSFRQR